MWMTSKKALPTKVFRTPNYLVKVLSQTLILHLLHIVVPALPQVSTRRRIYSSKRHPQLVRTRIGARSCKSPLRPSSCLTVPQASMEAQKFDAAILKRSSSEDRARQHRSSSLRNHHNFVQLLEILASNRDQALAGPLVQALPQVVPNCLRSTPRNQRPPCLSSKTTIRS